MELGSSWKFIVGLGLVQLAHDLEDGGVVPRLEVKGLLDHLHLQIVAVCLSDIPTRLMWVNNFRKEAKKMFA